MALTAYWIVHPENAWQGYPDGSQIHRGLLANNTLAEFKGYEYVSQQGPGTTYIDEVTPITVDASTRYILAWTIHDPTAGTYSDPVISYVETPADGLTLVTVLTPTYVPGSLTSTGFRVRVPVTWN